MSAELTGARRASREDAFPTRLHSFVQRKYAGKVGGQEKRNVKMEGEKADERKMAGSAGSFGGSGNDEEKGVFPYAGGMRTFRSGGGDAGIAEKKGYDWKS